VKWIELHRFSDEGYPPFVSRVLESQADAGQGKSIVGIKGDGTIGLDKERVEFVPVEVHIRQREIRKLTGWVQSDRLLRRF
jgi:hypothetical protein